MRSDIMEPSARPDRRRSGRLFGALAATVIAALVIAERRRALRAPRAETGDRELTNLAMAGLSAAASELAMTPVVRPLTRWAERERVGAVHWLGAPAWLRDALAVVLLDYTLYWWHVVEHRVAWLYRFHQVHHADLAMDTSTAVRFHFGEFLASVPWRAAQVVLVGASPRALLAWQRLTMLSVLFHHSNVRLPIVLERRLGRWLMTPRLHGIHHSVVREEQNSNWSSGLSFWDRLHGTYRANVPQDEVTVGIPALRDPADLTLPKSLALPFGELAPWEWPDGTVPRRRPAAAPTGYLLP